MANVTIQYRFRVRRRTAASWASLNEVLLDAEIGLESDTTWPGGGRKFKIGDGATAWNDLDYAVPDAGGGSGAVDPVTQSPFFDDFMGKPPTAVLGASDAGSTSDWSADVIGTAGSIIQSAAVSGARGLWRLSSGSGTTGLTAISRGGGVNNVLFGQGEIEDEWRIRIPTLSVALERFVTHVGWRDSWTAATNGVTVGYVDNVNSGKFFIRSVVAGVSTDYLGTTTVAANTFYRVKLAINAGGTQAELYVNDVLESTATTIPTVAMRAGAVVNSLTGTGPNLLDLDYYNSVETFSSPR